MCKVTIVSSAVGCFIVGIDNPTQAVFFALAMKAQKLGECG